MKGPQMRSHTQTRRGFLKAIGFGAAALAFGPARIPAAPRKARPMNVLLITADDMNCDSVGAYGCRVKQTTPQIDRLAAEGMRFERAHITIAVCQPCRSVLMTGRYPHRSGGEGFHRLRKPNVPILPDLLRKAGFQVGILGKVGHSTPYASFKWDMSYDMAQLGMGRNPDIYYKHAKAFFAEAKSKGRPFFLMANSHDPHRPFFGNDRKQWYTGDKTKAAKAPSQIFKPKEVEVPGFLAELPQVRLEISEYYSSVRRCDDTVGRVLEALKETSQDDNTLVIYLSDHGMPLPFAKTNCYLHSTRTPLIVRLPGKVKAGAVDADHFVSGIDLMPTVLDALGLDQPEGMDGFSFLPVLSGRKQKGRAMVFTQFHQTAGRNRYPMRCVQNGRFGYIFNAWSDGKRVFRNESQSGRTMKAMVAAGKSDPKIAARVKLFLYRVVEEFYDLEKDPDALNNLIDDPAYKPEVDKLRAELEAWMKRTGDVALAAFRNRDSSEALARFMAAQDKLTGKKKRRK